MEDLYSVLEVNKNASIDEIKKAYRRLAVKHHPDKNKGDPSAEDKFKKIVSAYDVLSNPDKKAHYDQFGTVDDGQGGGFPGMHGMHGMPDILKNMFGGGGFTEMPSGHPFSFMFPGGGGPPANMDRVQITVDLSDVYNGSVKKIELELLDKCRTCNGIGAASADDIITCMKCNGSGVSFQQMGPFAVQTQCMSCGGQGKHIKNNKVCGTCKGQKTAYYQKNFELKIPKGVPNSYEYILEKRGGFNVDSGTYNNIALVFKYKQHDGIVIDEHANVSYTMDVKLEDLLCGFNKSIDLYGIGDEYTITSLGYVNPRKTYRIRSMGLPRFKKDEHGDLSIHLNIVYPDDDRITKYTDVFCKVFKVQKQEEKEKVGKKHINISTHKE